MITNNVITFFHKTLNQQTRLEEWVRYIFNEVWVFKTKGGNVNQGYENSNSIDVRIPMEIVNNTDVFSIGDIICVGTHSNISTQKDLDGAEIFNVTQININDFGNNPHIHLRGA